MSFLDDRQFGVRVGHGEAGVGRLLGPVKQQGPVHDMPGLRGAVNEDDLQGPLAPRILGPCVGGHEGPFGEPILAVIIIWALRQDHGSGEYMMINIHFHLYMMRRDIT